MTGVAAAGIFVGLLFFGVVFIFGIIQFNRILGNLISDAKAYRDSKKD